MALTPSPVLIQSLNLESILLNCRNSLRAVPSDLMDLIMSPVEEAVERDCCNQEGISVTRARRGFGPQPWLWWDLEL